MSEDIMHGLAAIGSFVMLLIWGPVLWRKMHAIDHREWLHDQPLLVTAGLFMESIGVLFISAYRTVQIITRSPTSHSDQATNIAILFLVVGTAMLIRSAFLNGAKWRARIYLLLIASWLFFTLLIEPWLLERIL